MNQNYLKKYLDVIVLDDKTIIKYWNDDNLSFVHEHKIGLTDIEDRLVNEEVMSDWISGVVYSLHNISLLDRVPTFIYLSSPKYGTVFEKYILHPSTYSQFYIERDENGKGVRVIIKKINSANINSHRGESVLDKNLEKNIFNNQSKSYERYTKAISQFKV